MPELPELEALRIRLAPRLEGKLITAATVNPKKAHMLRYPVDNFANELPARRVLSLIRRGKHLVFGTELGAGGSERWLVINPMLGGRFQMADGSTPVPATEVFTIRIEGKQAPPPLQVVNAKAETAWADEAIKFLRRWHPWNQIPPHLIVPLR